MNEPPAIPLRIICRQHSMDSTCWCAWNEDSPFRRSSADGPAAAVRRFLESNCDGELFFDLACDEDLVGNGQTCHHAHWRDPELFVQCNDCHGTGVYTGFLSVEACRACQGRGENRVIC